MEKLIIVKLGGSVITDKSKPFCAKESVIRRLGQEIVKAKKKYPGKIIIAHGSGSFGHTYASKYQTQKGLINKNSLKGAVLTSDSAIDINRIVVKQLIAVGLNIKSFAPASFLLAENNKLKGFFVKPIKQALLRGIIPVVYGDVLMDINKGVCIFSAEKVIQVLVKELTNDFKIEKIIYCTNTDGVYDREGKTLEIITPNNFKKVKQEIGGSSGTDVTGGMLHKLEESLKVVKKFNLKILIINGKIRNNLRLSVEGNKITGTSVVNQQ